MTFTIYPAIDIRGGKCVRLYQGDFNQETVYGESPYDVAQMWSESGAAWLHVVDLDGAKEGTPVHFELIGEMAKSISVPIQVGGGIRTLHDIEAYMECGIARIILGTAALEDRSFTIEALRCYGSRIAIGLDCRNGYVATRGWLSTTQVQATEIAKHLAELGAELFIYTDIGRDGTLTGPNIEEIVHIGMATGKKVIASGGVGHMNDLLSLVNQIECGVEGAIVGKALYTKAISLSEALDKVREATQIC
ncbi:1-(5-phosphoribosyl)-5-[(5-phosphoribosylamino)methylideneamino]imidazole-4-carboxamide isomerase [Brevibacillus laterosporus]|uniref:1-(5-phosphoribosyl)-5-[(5- phosphoribosylamino)methylideneamino]imidazole-4- carboxamide isomerase n=1 Tax=Brevibacillus laterosporus TaxID=1465 RepID=UPI000839BA0D|nr:1-(5-phosphoribosyl)-5-[(5-phosphoribosylamino)methylideneamino]imidazole-4-carboxamide isomerase [Brevibacillus laterosporus]